MSLHDCGNIKLAEGIYDIEFDALEHAGNVEESVVHGRQGFIVLTDTGASES